MIYRIELKSWKKGLKLCCPECKEKIKVPFNCKCGAKLRPFVRFRPLKINDYNHYWGG